jgi:hypothetical protein
MSRRLRRELRLLRAHALVTTALLVILALSAFQSSRKTRFDEIDVQRINVVEPDGRLRMVISNTPRSIGPIYKGKAFGYPGGRRPGVIFFNDEGSENGGLGFGGSRAPDGTYHASSQLAFDQFDQDQVLYLSYNDNNGQRRLGLTVADRAVTPLYDLVMKKDSIDKMPDGPAKKEALARLMGPVNGNPMYAQRVYVGRDPSRSAIVNLSDPEGRPRLRLQVDSLGAPSLEFLDANGQVTREIR